MAKNFKNLITVYNFNAQQAKVSGVFYYFEVKFFPGREGGVTSQTTHEHMSAAGGTWMSARCNGGENSPHQNETPLSLDNC